MLFVTNLYVIKKMERDIFCYIHEVGEIVKCADGSVQYKGGRTKSIVVSGNISNAVFVSKLCGELNIDSKSIKLDFIVKFDPSCILWLLDYTAVLKMFNSTTCFVVSMSPHLLKLL